MYPSGDVYVRMAGIPTKLSYYKAPSWLAESSDLSIRGKVMKMRLEIDMSC